MRPCLPPILALLALGCGKPEPLTFTTFNAGLAVAFVPSAHERAPLVADAVAGLDSDVVCLQEVWLPEHVDLVRKAAKGRFDHTWFPEPDQLDMTAPACADAEIDPLVSCIETSCGGVCDDELVDCLFANCVLDFLGLGDTCTTCVMAHVGNAEPAEVAATCKAGGIAYAYGGSFGTGILSKYPIEVEHIVLDSTTNRRGLAHAVVDAPDGPVDAWCTHLTAGLSAIPYTGPFESWEAEQAAQVAQFADLLADAPDPVVVMGDLNNGPATHDAEAEFEENYQVVSAGFDDPYVEQDGRCTFCPDNHLSSVDTDAVGRLIDHVLVRGFEASEVAVRRELDKALPIESCGATIDGNYSDHYGVSVTLTP